VSLNDSRHTCEGQPASQRAERLDSQHKLPTDWLAPSSTTARHSGAIDCRRCAGCTHSTDTLRRRSPPVNVADRLITRDGVEVRAGLMRCPAGTCCCRWRPGLALSTLYTGCGDRGRRLGAPRCRHLGLWLAARIAGRIGQTSWLRRPCARVAAGTGTSHIRELDEMADTLAVVSHLQAECVPTKRNCACLPTALPT